MAHNISDGEAAADERSPLADRYLRELGLLLERLRVSQREALREAGAMIAAALQEDRLIHLFGTGHSHMLAEEGFHRAGGLAAVNPLLIPDLMLQGAKVSTLAERTSGRAPTIAAEHGLGAGDVLCIFSNSGVNFVPVELAQHAVSLGLRVIAVTCVAHGRATAARTHDGKKLYEVAHLVIDTGLPPGDALIQIPEQDIALGPASTVVGAAALNAMLINAAAELIARGTPVPAYRSSNLEGADAYNEKLIERYRHRIRLL
jgi:uncharacterized phosphosugar-binding protein